MKRHNTCPCSVFSPFHGQPGSSNTVRQVQDTETSFKSLFSRSDERHPPCVTSISRQMFNRCKKTAWRIYHTMYYTPGLLPCTVELIMTAATYRSQSGDTVVNVLLIAIRAACHYYAHKTSEFIDCGRAVRDAVRDGSLSLPAAQR